MSRGWEFEPDSYRPFYETASIIDVNGLSVPPLYEGKTYNGFMRGLKMAYAKAIELEPELADCHLWVVVGADSFKDPDGN